MNIYGESMTTRLTISVPDDVAARAAEAGNASRFFTEAVRERDTRRSDRQWMTARQIPFTEDGVLKAGAALDRAKAAMTPEAWAAAAQGPAAYAVFVAGQDHRAGPATGDAA
jgi:hypothetical protein